MPDILLQWKSHYQPLVWELVSVNAKHFSLFSPFSSNHCSDTGRLWMPGLPLFHVTVMWFAFWEVLYAILYSTGSHKLIVETDGRPGSILSLIMNSWSGTNEIRLCLCWCRPVKEMWKWIGVVKSIFKGRGINTKLWLLASMSVHVGSATEKAIVLF